MNKKLCVVLAVISFAFCVPAMGMKQFLQRSRLDDRARGLMVDELDKNVLSKECAIEWHAIFPGYTKEPTNKLQRMKEFFKKYNIDPNSTVYHEGVFTQRFLLSHLCELDANWSVYCGDFTDCIEHLLSHGAKPNEKSLNIYATQDEYLFYSASPVESLAMSRNSKYRLPGMLVNVAQLLIKYGAKVDPLVVAVARENGNEDLGQVLEKACKKQEAGLIAPVVNSMKNNGPYKIKNNEDYKGGLVTCEILPYE